MSRTSRQRSESGYYHVMIRGNNKKAIFERKEEKEKLCEILRKNKKKDGWKLIAYCIMNNHAHLLIKEDGEEISVIMKKINVSYAMYYNRAHKTVGHVFQDRYKSEAITDDRYLLTVIRCIHQNPVKSGVAEEIQEYKWSSYKEYTGESGGSLADTELIEMFSKDRKEAIKSFIAFHEEEDMETYLGDGKQKRDDEEKQAWEIIREKVIERNGIIDLAAKKEIVKTLLEKTKLSQRKIAEMLELDRGFVQRQRQSLKETKSEKW